MKHNTFMKIEASKRERIEQGLLQVFSEHMFENVKVSHITKEVNIPRSSFYSYFDDLYDAYEYVLDICMSKVKIIEKTHADYFADFSQTVTKENILDIFLKKLSLYLDEFFDSIREFKILYNLQKSDDVGLVTIKSYLDKQRGKVDADNYLAGKEVKIIREDVDIDMLNKLIDGVADMLVYDAIYNNTSKKEIEEKALKLLKIIVYGIV